MALKEESQMEKTAVEHVDHVEYVEHVEDQGDAKKAAQAERNMTPWQALQGNWKAALWSAVISLTIIMEGYDVGELLILLGTSVSIVDMEKA